jgi:hypothetical protein
MRGSLESRIARGRLLLAPWHPLSGEGSIGATSGGARVSIAPGAAVGSTVAIDAAVKAGRKSQGGVE